MWLSCCLLIGQLLSFKLQLMPAFALLLAPFPIQQQPACTVMYLGNVILCALITFEDSISFRSCLVKKLPILWLRTSCWPLWLLCILLNSVAALKVGGRSYFCQFLFFCLVQLGVRYVWLSFVVIFIFLTGSLALVILIVVFGIAPLRSWEE